MKSKNRKRAIFFLLATAIVFIGTLFVPLASPLIDATYSTTLLDENGKLLGAQIAKDEQWRFRSNNTLNPKYVKAVINFEDKRFFSHNGVDVQALLRAVYIDVKYRRFVSGGSTITMQLARIAEGNRPRTVFQKLKEMWMALRI